MLHYQEIFCIIIIVFCDQQFISSQYEMLNETSMRKRKTMAIFIFFHRRRFCVCSFFLTLFILVCSGEIAFLNLMKIILKNVFFVCCCYVLNLLLVCDPQSYFYFATCTRRRKKKRLFRWIRRWTMSFYSFYAVCRWIHRSFPHETPFRFCGIVFYR